MFVVNANDSSGFLKGEQIIDSTIASNKMILGITSGVCAAGCISSTKKIMYGFAATTSTLTNRTYGYYGGAISYSWSLGTITANIYPLLFQGGSDSNYFLYSGATGTPTSLITGKEIYPVIINDSTQSITLGSALSVPVIAGKTISMMLANGSDVYVWYRDNSTYVIDTGRKYTGSWATLSGGALPSTINTNFKQDSLATNRTSYPLPSTTCPVSGKGYGITNRPGNNIGMEFDFATDTWSELFDNGISLGGTLSGIQFDVGGLVGFYNGEETIVKNGTSIVSMQTPGAFSSQQTSIPNDGEHGFTRTARKSAYNTISLLDTLLGAIIFGSDYYVKAIANGGKFIVGDYSNGISSITATTSVDYPPLVAINGIMFLPSLDENNNSLIFIKK